MKLRNVAKTIFASAVLSAALCFGTVAMPANVAKMAAVEAATVAPDFTGVSGGFVYLQGKKLPSGLVQKNADNKFYVVKDGKIGNLYTGIYTGVCVYESTASTVKFVKFNDTYIKNGAPATGVISLKLYLEGKFASTFTGWQVVDGKRYYFTNGVAAAKQFKLVPAYTNNGKKYKYYFRADGQVSENMFIDYGYSKTIKWLKKAKGVKKTHMLSVDLVSHNMTIYLYDKATKAFDIPAKVTVCSTSRKKNGTPVGHWRLEKTSAKRWVTVKDSKPVRRYQWAVHIIGTPTLFHSSAYATLGNAKSLYAYYYNGLGTSQTSYCIRQQACNAKIVYDLAKLTYKKQRVMVDIGRMKKAGPFAKITLKDTTGKLSSKRKTDPTDPVLFPNNKWWK